MYSPPRPICMDHAATSALDPRVLEAMLPWLRGSCGNPSSTHGFGRQALALVEAARATVAEVLGAKPSEVLFTSGGTESDNLALRGVVLGKARRGKHIVTLPVEHHAVTHTCNDLNRGFGCKVTYLPVDRFGRVNPEEVSRAITPETSLVSIMYANNEVGTIEPVEEIAKIAQANRVPLHTDGVQAAGSLPLNVNKLGVDLLSLSGHKFYGPMGVGVLYVREGTRIAPSQTGGAQERGLRAGTENVPGIIGLAVALKLADQNLFSEARRLSALRDLLIEGVSCSIPHAHLTGHPTGRLANNASFVFEGVNSTDLVRELDSKGVAASGGSACTSCNQHPSHVLTAMGYDSELARGALRLTLGRENTEEDIGYVLSILPGIVERLRDRATGSFKHMSPGGVSASEASLGVGADTERNGSGGLWNGSLVLHSLGSSGGLSNGDVEASGIADGASSHLVYTLGQLGYDFVTEARRDSFLQQTGADDLDARRLLEHLEANPSASTGVIWTLNVDNVPIYAIAPSGAYAADGYKRLRELLAAQSADGMQWISVPGICGGSVRLLNRQSVPVLVPEVRGIAAWSTQALVQAVLGKRPAKKQDRGAYEQTAAEVSNFLERICYELRNLGITPQERAINYAATCAYQLGQVFQETVKAGLKLDGIDAEKTPICRPGSDCWDVKLTFFNPSKRIQEARKVCRITVDVSDVVPVTRGKVRQWHQY